MAWLFSIYVFFFVFLVVFVLILQACLYRNWLLVRNGLWGEKTCCGSSASHHFCWTRNNQSQLKALRYPQLSIFKHREDCPLDLQGPCFRLWNQHRNSQFPFFPWSSVCRSILVRHHDFQVDDNCITREYTRLFWVVAQLLAQQATYFQWPEFLTLGYMSDSFHRSEWQFGCPRLSELQT